MGKVIERELAAHPVRLLIDDRRLMSLSIYYAGERAHNAFIWNPERMIDNHYRFLCDVVNAPHGPFLFISTVERDNELRAQFERVEAVGKLDGGPCPGCERRVFVYRLGDFRGYPPS